MRIIILFIFLAITDQAHANVWIDEPTKTVTVLPTPVLKVEILEVGTDNEFWASVIMNWGYNIQAFEAELGQLQVQYPKYIIQRSQNPHIQGDIRVAFPGGITRQMEVQNTPEGPQFSYQGFFSKREYAKLKTQDLREIKLLGQQKVTVPISEILQTVIFPGSVCQSLGGKTSEMIRALSVLMEELKRGGRTKNESFMANVVNNVIDQCLTFDASWSANIGSVKDFLALTFLIKAHPKDILVQELRSKTAENIAPLTWKLELEAK